MWTEGVTTLDILRHSRTNGRTGPAAGFQVVVAMLRETAVGYTEYHEPESLGSWVRWCLDCIMMYGPKGFSRVWGLTR